MQTTSPTTPASPIRVPEIDSEQPVAVVPVASVAPLEGEPDGERIETFAVVPKDERALSDHGAAAMADMRARVRSKPVTYLAAAFSLGFILGRVLR